MTGTVRLNFTLKSVVELELVDLGTPLLLPDNMVEVVLILGRRTVLATQQVLEVTIQLVVMVALELEVVVTLELVVVVTQQLVVVAAQQLVVVANKVVVGRELLQLVTVSKQLVLTMTATVTMCLARVRVVHLYGRLQSTTRVFRT